MGNSKQRVVTTTISAQPLVLALCRKLLIKFLLLLLLLRDKFAKRANKRAELLADDC